MSQEIPDRIGPVELEAHGRMIAVRAPREFDPIMRRVGGQWDKGMRVWWVQQRRIGRLVRALEAKADPLFRHAGVDV